MVEEMSEFDSVPDAGTLFQYSVSDGVAQALESLNTTLWVSTYQVDKLAVFRSSGGRVSMLPRTFDKAMGFAVDHAPEGARIFTAEFAVLRRGTDRSIRRFASFLSGCLWRDDALRG